jgi:hypothetical protein
MSTTPLQNHPSIEEPFVYVDTVPLALFDHLGLSFLNEFPVFAPDNASEAAYVSKHTCSWRSVSDSL